MKLSRRVSGENVVLSWIGERERIGLFEATYWKWMVLLRMIDGEGGNLNFDRVFFSLGVSLEIGLMVSCFDPFELCDK